MHVDSTWIIFSELQAPEVLIHLRLFEKSAPSLYIYIYKRQLVCLWQNYNISTINRDYTDSVYFSTEYETGNGQIIREPPA